MFIKMPVYFKHKYMISFIYILLALFMLYILRKTELSSLSQFAVTVVITCASMFFFGGGIHDEIQTSEKNNCHCTLLSKWSLFKQLVLTVCVCIGLWILDYNAKDMLGKVDVGIGPESLICCIIITTLLYWGVVCRQCRPFNSLLVRRIIEPLFAILVGWLYYRPNVVTDELDFGAYWNSVVQLLNGIPYSMSETSLYGHYALVLAPVFKLFGLSIYIASAIMMCEAVLTFGFFCLTYNALFENENIKIILVFATFWLFGVYGSGFYPQGIPHRFLFMAIIFFSIAKMQNNEGKVREKWEIIGLVLSAMAIMWCTDTGICLSIAYCISILWNKKPQNNRAFILHILSAGIRFLLIFGLAYLFVGFANLSIGGKFISVREFLYPIGTKSVWPSEVHFKELCWIIALAFLLLNLFLEIFKLLNKRIDGSFRIAIVAFSIMFFTYFYNRASFSNLVVTTFFPIITLLGIYIDERKDDDLNRGLKIISISLFLSSMIFLTPLVVSRDKIYKDISKLYVFQESISNLVPENCYIYGYGSGLYQMLTCRKALPWDGVIGRSDLDYELLGETIRGARADMAILDPDRMMREIYEHSDITFDEIDNLYSVSTVMINNGYEQEKVLLLIPKKAEP